MGDAIAAAPEVTGLFVYGQETTGTNYLLAATGDKVWSYSAGWTDKTGAYSLTAGAQHFGLTFNNVFIGVTSARDAPYKKDGAADIAALGGTPPNGKVLGRIGEFIVIANTAAAPSLAYSCDPGNAEAGWVKY
jgi:outer membrane protein assembly factor BamB